jgi:RNA polymerase sigma-70 factor (ECF subfamily)
MAGEGSFDGLMARLRSGDEEAAARVFQRFAQQLVLLARSQLADWVSRKVDPEDIVQSVYKSFFARCGSGQFDLANWDSLWSLLTVITVRKCLEQAEYYSAARRDVRREVSAALRGEADAVCEALARDPTPSEAAALTDLLGQWLGGLEEPDRVILTLHLQGYTLAEIGSQVGRARRTVQRAIERGRRRLRRLQATSEGTA